jgi:hypothetical protein
MTCVIKPVRSACGVAPRGRYMDVIAGTCWLSQAGLLRHPKRLEGRVRLAAQTSLQETCAQVSPCESVAIFGRDTQWETDPSTSIFCRTLGHVEALMCLYVDCRIKSRARTGRWPAKSLQTSITVCAAVLHSCCTYLQRCNPLHLGCVTRAF